MSKIEARHRRRSRPSAASGISHATYHGASDAALTSSATAAQPAPTIQSSRPHHTRQSSQHSTAANSAPRASDAGRPTAPRPRCVPMNPGMLCPLPLLWAVSIVAGRLSGPVPKITNANTATSAAAIPAPISRSRRRSARKATPGVREREWQEYAGGHLDRGAEDDRGCAEAIAALEDENQARDHRREHQQVVVASADAVDDDQRVEPDERRCPDRVDAAQACTVPHERDDCDARKGRDRLVGEHAGRDRQWSQHIAERGEQRTVDRWRADPLGPDVLVERIAGERVGACQIRIEAVQLPDPAVELVAEDVGGGQRRREQDQRVECRDAAEHEHWRQAAGSRDGDHVGDEHQPDRDDQPGAPQVDAAVAERTREAARRARPQRLRQEFGGCWPPRSRAAGPWSASLLVRGARDATAEPGSVPRARAHVGRMRRFAWRQAADCRRSSHVACPTGGRQACAHC